MVELLCMPLEGVFPTPTPWDSWEIEDSKTKSRLVSVCSCGQWPDEGARDSRSPSPSRGGRLTSRLEGGAERCWRDPAFPALRCDLGGQSPALSGFPFQDIKADLGATQSDSCPGSATF